VCRRRRLRPLTLVNDPGRDDIVRNRRRFPLLAVATVAVLTAATAACTRPPTGTPDTTTTTTAPTALDVQTRKIRYGPFAVPAVDQPGRSSLSWALPLLGIELERGMIWNEPVRNVAKPCEDCYLTGITAGLEYADGSNANINNGLWLHHMVLMASGPGKWDATCRGNAFSLPHIAVGGNPGNTERIFASGNERTPMDLLDMQSERYGYKLNRGDAMHMLVDLMNLNRTEQSVYLTLDYNYVAGNTPGFRDAKPVWLDANQCGTSEVPARTGQYTVPARPWTANFAGTFLGGGAHFHDGGTHATIAKNGEVFCTSEAKYGTKPEYMDPEPEGGHGGDGGHAHGGMHISEQTLCEAGGTIAVGDQLTLTAHYDDTRYPQMVHDGKLHSVMSIAILYYGL
jgi:hypothetical protein